MIRTRMHLTAAVILCALLAAPGVRASTPVEERQAAAPDGRVQISNLAGSIVVDAWDEPEIEITGTLGEDVERLDFVRDADLTVIKVVYPSGKHNGEGSHLSIRVPGGSALEISGVSASIEVSGVQGRQRLRTVSGDVRTETVAEDVEAETVSGDVTVRGRDDTSHTTLTTVSGDIQADGVSGEIDAGTVSGGIEVQGRMLSRARLNTTNGRISLDAGLASGGRFDLSTTNGGVDLMLDTDGDLDVDAQTFNGRIDNCFGIDPAKSQFTPERTLRFTQGEADRSIRIRTMNGRIELCSRTHSG
ncbi:MAG: DUF4097 family beta strand repeat-containing protein [Pseudomonadales bacterium]